MSVPASLLPELEDVVQHGSPEKRAETLHRITGLFLEGAPVFNDEHVGLFDDVISYLIEEIETKALAELSQRLAPVPNAPEKVVGTLAMHDDIAVAAPVLKAAKLDETALVSIAQTKSQAHLLAISARKGISEPVSEVLATRGDLEVARSLATNASAKLSENAIGTLVRRAESDSVLAEKVGLRSDIPPRLFRQLLLHATEVVQQRLLAAAKPDTQSEIKRVLAKVSNEVAAKAAPRNYAQAIADVRALQKDGKLGEAEVVDYANAEKYEHTIAAMAAICTVPIEVVDRLMGGERADPVLIMARSAGFGWQTVRAILTSRRGAKGTSSAALEAAKENFDRLTPATAQRVVRFWQVRQAVGE